MSQRAGVAVAVTGSAALLLLPLQTWRPVPITPIEALAAITTAWSVWLLARNHVAGWWIGLVSVAAYAVVFHEARLFAEVGLQGVYFVTSLQAIWIWLRGGSGGTQRPVSTMRWRLRAPIVAVGVAATIGLCELLGWLRGAAPAWDAVITVLSLIAHGCLMWRFVESWYLWVAVDTVCVPLYASRELYVTSALYAVLWVLAVQGLLGFRRLLREQAGGGGGAVP